MERTHIVLVVPHRSWGEDLIHALGLDRDDAYIVTPNTSIAGRRFNRAVVCESAIRSHLEARSPSEWRAYRLWIREAVRLRMLPEAPWLVV